VIVASSAEARSAAPSSVRLLRWTFRRDEETVVCELTLTPDDSAYELRVRPAWDPVGAAPELFDDAVTALQRHASIERALVNEGWSLDRIESDRIER
jgi:hypothetical protein